MIQVASKYVWAIPVLMLLAFSCRSASMVHFESPVDTKSKVLNQQVKTTYALKEIGVYASNEFDGARMNGFEMRNDSTALVIIKPENTPINNSLYHTFQSFLMTLMDNSILASDFMDRYQVLHFPVMNPDGMDLGHWQHRVKGLNTDEKRNGTEMPEFVYEWFLALEKNIEGYKVNEHVGNSKNQYQKVGFYTDDAVGITYKIEDVTLKEKLEAFGKISAIEWNYCLTKNN